LPGCCSMRLGRSTFAVMRIRPWLPVDGARG
jgi:hypothetical protein